MKTGKSRNVKISFKLKDQEREIIQKLLSRGKESVRVIKRAQIIALVCSDAPDGYDRWTLELIVKKSIEKNIVPKVGRETIRILMKTHGLKAWREKNVVHSGDNN